MAETVVATPRKMNPTPIQMASNRIAVAEMPERQHGQDQRRRPADEQQDPAARRNMQAEREDDLRDAGDQQVGAERDGGDQDGSARPGQHQDAQGQRQNSR